MQYDDECNAHMQRGYCEDYSKLTAACVRH